jgi:HSP20 family protein
MAHSFREARELTDDVRRVFEELERQSVGRRVAGECVPAVDVLESPAAVEIVVDLPGVQPDSVRVLMKGGLVLIAGEKEATACASPNASFHLVERGFGRFARVVRLTGAFDAARAEALLEVGELRVVIPKIGERRGHELAVPIRQIDRVP